LYGQGRTALLGPGKHWEFMVFKIENKNSQIITDKLGAFLVIYMMYSTL
jgi:hypothetical protein